MPTEPLHNSGLGIAPGASADPAGGGAWGFTRRGLEVRLFLTCWLIYFLHFSPFFTRELYLTLALVEDHSVRVDKYLGMHSDLFLIPGRGGFMGGNPGASIAAAIPYQILLPLVNRVAPVRPIRLDQGGTAETTDPRAMRRMFFRRARELGVDVRLGVAAMLTAGFFMAPLSALSAVVMMRLFRRMQLGVKASLWLALLYALGTPIFFRSATLSLNLMVGLLALFAFALLWWPSGARPERERWRYLAAGFLAGYAVLTDYSGAVPAAALGLFALSVQWRKKPFLPAVRFSLWFLAGAAGPVLFLLWWQWYCYGNPWLPAQYHMPAQYYQNYASERGFGRPLPAIAWGLLFDPLYGLLVFSPIFAVALFHFALLWRRQNRVPGDVVLFTWLFTAAYWTFCSMIHYTLRHQWQDGVRYVVPVLPFLFLLIGDVLVSVSRGLAYIIGFFAVAQMWCISMVRENPFESIVRVLFRGPELPSLTTFTRVAKNYYPPLAENASPLVVFVLFAVVLAGIWMVREPERPLSEEG